MYDELVKRLRECASGECFNCSQYTETTNASVCSKELMKQVADAIEELSKPKWIPVTERLPEMHEKVLICNDDYGKTVLGFATVAVWDGSDWVNAWDGEGTICCVTHWMPFPEPPEEE